MALAAWQPPRPPGIAVLSGWRTLALPFAFGLASIALLVAAGLGHLSAAAVLFAGGALMVSMIRTAFTFRELRTLSETRQQATTDELTGLPNRRWFHQHLRASIADAERAGGQLALLSIDLDHPKELNALAIRSRHGPGAFEPCGLSRAQRVWRGGVKRPLGLARLEEHHRDLAVGLGSHQSATSADVAAALDA